MVQASYVRRGREDEERPLADKEAVRANSVRVSPTPLTADIISSPAILAG